MKLGAKSREKIKRNKKRKEKKETGQTHSRVGPHYKIVRSKKVVSQNRWQ